MAANPSTSGGVKVCAHAAESGVGSAACEGVIDCGIGAAPAVAPQYSGRGEGRVRNQRLLFRRVPGSMVEGRPAEIGAGASGLRKSWLDARYSKRLPAAVEQPVRYTSPFRR